MSDDIVGDSHEAIEFLRKFGASLEIHEHVNALFMSVELVCELPFVPFCGGFDGSGLFFDNGLKPVGDFLDGVVGEVGLDDIEGFVFSFNLTQFLLPMDCFGPDRIRDREPCGNRAGYLFARSGVNDRLLRERARPYSNDVPLTFRANL